MAGGGRSETPTGTTGMSADRPVPDIQLSQKRTLARLEADVKGWAQGAGSSVVAEIEASIFGIDCSVSISCSFMCYFDARPGVWRGR